MGGLDNGMDERRFHPLSCHVVISISVVFWYLVPWAIELFIIKHLPIFLDYYASRFLLPPLFEQCVSWFGVSRIVSLVQRMDSSLSMFLLSSFLFFYVMISLLSRLISCYFMDTVTDKATPSTSSFHRSISCYIDIPYWRSSLMTETRRRESNSWVEWWRRCLSLLFMVSLSS